MPSVSPRSTVSAPRHARVLPLPPSPRPRHGVMARLADAGSHHIRQLDRDHQPVGQAIGIAKRGAFERGEAVRVLVSRRSGFQDGIA